MNAPFPLFARSYSPLEWLGWEVAAERALILQRADARMLGRLVRNAPHVLSLAFLAEGGVLKPARAELSVRVYISHVRQALRQVGLGEPVRYYETDRGGYGVGTADAHRIRAFVEAHA